MSLTGDTDRIQFVLQNANANATETGKQYAKSSKYEVSIQSWAICIREEPFSLFVII